MIDDPEDDVLMLLGRLVEKILRALSVKHIDTRQQSIVDRAVRGRIEWDESSAEGMPLVVVDGREIFWVDFGRMLMTFEGWQFRLEIGDPSDEL